MKIAVSRHVFGSIRGYTTLAKSEDLSGEEIAKLEILSFGQTNESSYFGSLRTNPAYVSRPLHSGRWAVSRVFEGKPDDHNRTTLLFVSAIITMDDWLYSLKCDVNKLLYCPNLWTWDGAERLEPIEITVEDTRETPAPEIRNKVLSLLAAVEKYERDENTTIIVRSSDFDAETLRWLNMVLPLGAKKTFSCAARSLSDGLPFALISMAKEGSFGNSRRRVIKWALTSAVDDCPYTESVTEFWQPGDEPPWRFIDSCKSFLIDLVGEPETLQRERFVREKVVPAQVRERRVKRRTYFSRKLAVASLICAVIGCLAIVITIGAMRFKTRMEVSSSFEAIIKKANNFLAQNSVDKSVSPDKSIREQAIKQGELLKYEVEALLAQANDPALNKIKSGLDLWLNSATNADQIYVHLDSRFRQLHVFNLGKNHKIYPSSEKTKLIDDLEKFIANVPKENLVSRYVSQAVKNLQDIRRWIGDLLKSKKDEAAKTIQSCELEIALTNYTRELYQKYEKRIGSLEKLRKDESLTNAKDSSIKEDRETAAAIERTLDRALEGCNTKLRKLESFKKDAETHFEKAVAKLEDPNAANGEIDYFYKLQEAQSHLDEVNKLWPGKPDLQSKKEKLNEQYRSNFANFLRKKEDEMKKIAAVVTSGKLEGYRIDERLTEFEEVESISEQSDIPDVDKLLQRLSMLAEKAERLKSDIIAIKENLQKELASAEDCIKQLEKTPRLIIPQEKEYKLCKEAQNHISKAQEIQPTDRQAIELQKLQKRLSAWKDDNKLTVDLGETHDWHKSHLQKVKKLGKAKKDDLKRKKLAEELYDKEKKFESLEKKMKYLQDNRMFKDLSEIVEMLRKELPRNLTAEQRENK